MHPRPRRVDGQGAYRRSARRRRWRRWPATRRCGRASPPFAFVVNISLPPLPLANGKSARFPEILSRASTALPLTSAAAEPMPRGLVDRSRQIAMDLPGVAARGVSDDFDFAGSARQRAVGSRCAAADVGVRDLELLELHLRRSVAALPFHDALQRVEHDGSLQDARKIERHVVARDSDLAAVDRGLDAAGETRSFPERRPARRAPGA